MTDFDYSDRLMAAREAMDEAGLDALLLPAGSDLTYLTGYAAIPSERLTMFVLTQRAALIVVPELEAPRISPGPYEVAAWGETEDPIRIVSRMVGAARRVGVGDRTWASFLLALQASMEAEFESATPAMAHLRLIKDAAEIERLRRAAHAADRVAARLATTQFSGLSERQLSRRVSDWIIDKGHETASFAIVASGPNGASPHHGPGDRTILPGDAVVIDFGGTVGGYCSDTTRTFTVGPPSPRQTEVHSIVLSARDRAFDLVEPGVSASDIDAAARSVIAEAGYGEFFIHRTGHGIGLDGHEHPYLVASNQDPIEAGMAFSIEPGIYLPGEFGVRIEDIVVVTGAGAESLNRSDRSLLTVG